MSSSGTGKSGQIICVTKILPSLWFPNRSSTYQKGNLHCNPINPLPALLFFPPLFIQVLVSLHIMWFLMARSCCCAHDGRDVCVLSHCCVYSCSEGRRAPYWNARDEKSHTLDESTVFWHARAKRHGPICIGSWTGLSCAGQRRGFTAVSKRSKDRQLDGVCWGHSYPDSSLRVNACCPSIIDTKCRLQWQWRL